MGDRLPEARILIYSHDSFGLGHLQRCRTIAHALVERYKGLSVLIVSGSPIIGSFDFRTRVDFVRIPGVIKLRNGDYSALSLHMDIGRVVKLRADIIRHTAESFQPDLVLVDKEPLGLRGELEPTLRAMRATGVPLVLGLRDIMDEGTILAREWQAKDLVPALEEFYDQIWVYGLPQVYEPLTGIALPPQVSDRIVYTGYLERVAGAHLHGQNPESGFDEPYLLVTTGGGGDGEELIDWVLSAYEHDPDIPHPALLLYGPFMSAGQRGEFWERVARLPRVKAMTFDARSERLVAAAAGVVAMGGYNTFCEILSFDRPAVIVPRRQPRLEQYIRAARAEELGLMRMLSDERGRDPAVMAAALRALPTQRQPSEVVVPGLLEGLDNITRLVERWLTFADVDLPLGDAANPDRRPNARARPPPRQPRRTR